MHTKSVSSYTVLTQADRIDRTVGNEWNFHFDMTEPDFHLTFSLDNGRNVYMQNFK